MTATSGPAPAATDEETAPTGRVLINELSSATSNTYQEPDGTRTLESFTAPVNYQGEEGEWQPIDNTFVDAPGSTYAVENAANAYTAQIPADASTTPVRFTVGDDWVTMRLHGADSAPVVDDNEATFGEMDNADAVAYVATPSGLKENITLDEAPGAGDAQLTYVYSIDASAGLTPFLGAGNEIEFQDAAGEAEIEIPAGLMFDSAEVPSSSGAVEGLPRVWLTPDL